MSGGRSDEIPGYRTRARVETLFATAYPDIDPEGLISRYLDYEFYRFRQDRHLAISGNLHARLKVLHWYLNELGGYRARPLPLSRRQLAFLNAPVSVLGLGPEISVAAYSFIVNEWPGSFDPRNEENVRDALSWWCVERAPRLARGGELTTQAQVHILTHVEGQDAGKRFHINDFVRRQRAGDALLQAFDPSTEIDRATLICILILRSVERPFFSRLLPTSAVAELLSVPAPGEPCLFVQLAARALTDGPKPDLEGALALKSRIEETLWRVDSATTGLARGPAGSRKIESRDAAPCLAPDPRVRDGLEAGLAVVGPLGAASGLGQAARLSIETLAQAGRSPAPVDFSLENPAPIGFTPSRNAPILRTPRQINLIHLNADSVPMAFAYLDKRLWERSYNIGYFFWELDRPPSFHDLALDLLDEVWVSSEYNREIYARVADIPVHNVGMAVEALPEALPFSRAEFGLDEDAFVFLATFDSFSFIERKNPLGLLKAFQAAFPIERGERVELVLKTQNRARVGDPYQLRAWQRIDDIVARDSRIRVIDQTLSYPLLLGLKRACDAYVSLHRSEGLGFGMLEAMQLARPVIATAYSGNMDFCSPETAFLVDYELVPVGQAEYIFVERGSRWAEPSLDSAVAALRRVFDDPDEAAARGEAARRRVESAFSVAAIARRYGARLDAIEMILAEASMSESASEGHSNAHADDAA